MAKRKPSSSWIENARILQRKGLTFTEISNILQMPRTIVIARLYWDLAR